MVMMIQEVYGQIDELIELLRDVEQHKLAEMLDHRMHKVSWTSASELLECIEGLLEEALETTEVMGDKELAGNIKNILETIHSLNQFSER